MVDAAWSLIVLWIEAFLEKLLSHDICSGVDTEDDFFCFWRLYHLLNPEFNYLAFNYLHDGAEAYKTVFEHLLHLVCKQLALLCVPGV